MTKLNPCFLLRESLSKTPVNYYSYLFFLCNFLQFQQLSVLFFVNFITPCVGFTCGRTFGELFIYSILAVSLRPAESEAIAAITFDPFAASKYKAVRSHKSVSSKTVSERCVWWNIKAVQPCVRLCHRSPFRTSRLYWIQLRHSTFRPNSLKST